MKILAIEASGLTASAAVLCDDRLLGEYTVNNKMTHSETLLPMIEALLGILKLTVQDMDAIAVSAGPGSFTGLRIGAATAKGLALAADLPIIRVSSLAAMGYNVHGDEHTIVCPIMDARRGQVYSAAYRDGLEIIPEAGRDIHEFIAMLNAVADKDLPGGNGGVESAERAENTANTENAGYAGHADGAENAEYAEYASDAGMTGCCPDFVFLGDGVPVHEQTIIAELKTEPSFATAENNRQRAASVAVLGGIAFTNWMSRNGLTEELLKEKGADGVDCFDRTVMNSDDFAPDYLRKPQAEREMQAGILEDPGKHSLKKIGRGEKVPADRTAQLKK